LVSNHSVLVADDDGPIRRMLERTLAGEGFSVTSVGDGGAALAAVERSVPDVIVLDVAMPGLDGLAVCRRLRAKGIAVPVLLLTARDAVAERVNGLEAGADDYLVKPFASEELVARLQALLRRNRPASTRLTFRDVVFDVDTREATRGGRDLDLTIREAELLEFLLRNSGVVVTRQQALGEIWTDSLPNLNVVDRYVAYLRRKLGEPPLIATVRGVGFKLG
jgi:two-component system response regulator MprA